MIRIYQCIFQTESCEWLKIRISYIWIWIHHLEIQSCTKWFESKLKWFESISVFFKQKDVNGQEFESPTYGFESITWKLKIALSNSNPSATESNPSTTDSNPTDRKCFLTVSFWRIEDFNCHNHSPMAINDIKGNYTPKISEEDQLLYLEKQEQHKSKRSNNSKRKFVKNIISLS